MRIEGDRGTHEGVRRRWGGGRPCGDPNYYKGHERGRSGEVLHHAGRRLTYPRDALQHAGQCRDQYSVVLDGEAVEPPEHNGHQGQRRQYRADLRGFGPAPKSFSVFAGSGATSWRPSCSAVWAEPWRWPMWCRTTARKFRSTTRRETLQRPGKCSWHLPLNGGDEPFRHRQDEGGHGPCGLQGRVAPASILPASDDTRKEIARILKELNIPTV